MAFDGLSLRAISCELKKLIGYKIDKIYEPTKNDILLGLYSNKTKFTLNVCIDSKFYRMNLTTHPKPNPTISPNFCMLLRKHIIGYKIKDIITYGLERVIAFELESFESNDKNIKYLIIELMGKHSNIILTNKNKIIINSLRHTNSSNNSYRNVFPKQQYVLPKSNKQDFEQIKNFDSFYNIVGLKIEDSSIEKVIANTFTGISFSEINFLTKKCSITSNSKENIKKLYNLIKNIINEADNCNLKFEHIDDKNFGLIINDGNYNNFDLNFFIDNFYFEKEYHSNFMSYKNSILKLVFNVLKKYNKRLININNKLKECDNLNTYRLYGELLTANLYKFNNQHLDNVTVFNYIANKDISINLDKKYTVNENSKRYFKKYNKLKNALNVVQKQKEDTLLELEYIESIIYELENATTIEEVNFIYDEFSENVIFKSQQDNNKKRNIAKKKKNHVFNPLTFNINDFTVLVGRNNRENDWLTTKYASSNDLWFHTKDIHGSHVILKNNKNLDINQNILIQCAKLASKHSKAKNSSNVPVDYTLVKYVKKPNGAKPGMVIYTHNKTLYVNPCN